MTRSSSSRASRTGGSSEALLRASWSMFHNRLILGAGFLGALVSLACDSRPTPPTALALPIAPTPTPTPSPTATPNPDVPPSGSGCRKPYPPAISRMNVKVHFKQRSFWNLDATPLVGHDVSYCRRIGFTDGRSLCPVRPEGAPDRVACENWRVDAPRTRSARDRPGSASMPRPGVVLPQAREGAERLRAPPGESLPGARERAWDVQGLHAEWWSAAPRTSTARA